MLNGTCPPQEVQGAGSVPDNVGCKRYTSVSRCPLQMKAPSSQSQEPTL